MSIKIKLIAFPVALATALTTVPTVSTAAGASGLTSTDEDSPPAHSSTGHRKPQGSSHHGADAARGANSATPGTKKHNTLRYGAHGTRVKAAQQRLKHLGYFLPKVDSKFGPSTQQAVWALQKAAGIKRTGTIDARTSKALDAGRRPKAARSDYTGIEVNIKRQLLLVVKHGTVKHIFNASTGRPGRSTVRGDYRVDRQINGVRRAELGQLYRPKYFYGGYAVHGEWFSVPEYPASHGCVRVSNPAMDWIWKADAMPLRSFVYVH